MYASEEVDALLSQPVRSTVKTRWERKQSMDTSNNTGSINAATLLQPRTPFHDRIAASNTSATPSGNVFSKTPKHAHTSVNTLPSANKSGNNSKTPGKPLTSLTCNIAQQLSGHGSSASGNVPSVHLNGSKTPSSKLHSYSSSSNAAGNQYADRMIPRRDSMDLSINLNNLSISNAKNIVYGGAADNTTENLTQQILGFTHGSNNNTGNINNAVNGNSSSSGVQDENAHTSDFKQQLASTLLFNSSQYDSNDINSKILSYKQKAPKPALDSYNNNLRVIYTHNQQLNGGSGSNAKSGNGLGSSKSSTVRYVSGNPERILDAPDMVDDYYLNLLDWSTLNMVAVGLGRCVYLWDASSGTIDLLCENQVEDDIVTSVAWMQDGTHVAVGTNNSVVQLWNIQQKKQVRSMKGHQSRIGSLAWNQHVLSSGSRDNTIHHHDVRVAQHHIGTLVGHEQEICGLKWSTDGTQLASGSNDNTCRIWEFQQSAAGAPSHQQQARHVLNDSHAAVKAVAWCPWQKHTLATGSGTADRHIRLYNTNTGTLTQSIDTGSQVCSLLWSRHEKELLSAHGFSQNQLSLWKYPSMACTHQLTGHTSRVLHMALSADGTTVCSGAADETLRFWKVWDIPQKKQQPTSTPFDDRRGVLAINIR